MISRTFWSYLRYRQIASKKICESSQKFHGNKIRPVFSFRKWETKANYFSGEPTAGSQRSRHTEAYRSTDTLCKCHCMCFSGKRWCFIVILRGAHTCGYRLLSNHAWIWSTTEVVCFCFSLQKAEKTGLILFTIENHNICLTIYRGWKRKSVSRKPTKAMSQQKCAECNKIYKIYQLTVKTHMLMTLQ